MSLAMRESWQTYRKRMLDETSRFIEWGLKHPELVMEIPVKPASEGSFPAEVGTWFWGVALSSSQDSWVQRWRRFLVSKPREFLRRRGKLRPRGS